MHTLLDQSRRDDMQTIGCLTLFDFVNNQVSAFYLSCWMVGFGIILTACLHFVIGTNTYDPMNIAERWNLHV